MAFKIEIPKAGVLACKKGEDIYQEEQIGNKIFVVKTGKVSIYKLKGDNYIELELLGPNEIFGYLPFMYGEQKRFTSAMALTDSEVVDITKPFIEMYGSLPDMMKSFVNNTSRKLKRAYFEIKTLQYFENIHYDDTKSSSLQTYHIRDIMKFSILLLLCFDRNNFTIGRDEYENTVFSLLAAVTVRMDTFLKSMVQSKIISVFDEDGGRQSINLINQERLEAFNNYLQRNFIKDPRKLLLNDTHLELIESIAKLADKENQRVLDEVKMKMRLDERSDIEKEVIMSRVIKEVNRGGISFTKDAFTAPDSENKATLVFQGLSDRGVLERVPHESGKMLYSINKAELFDIREFQKIIKVVERIK